MARIAMPVPEPGIDRETNLIQKTGDPFEWREPDPRFGGEAFAAGNDPVMRVIGDNSRGLVISRVVPCLHPAKSRIGERAQGRCRIPFAPLFDTGAARVEDETASRRQMFRNYRENRMLIVIREEYLKNMPGQNDQIEPQIEAKRTCIGFDPRDPLAAGLLSGNLEHRARRIDADQGPPIRQA